MRENFLKMYGVAIFEVPQNLIDLLRFADVKISEENKIHYSDTVHKNIFKRQIKYKYY